MRSVDAGAEQAANPRAHACAPEQVAVSPPDTCAFFSLARNVVRAACGTAALTARTGYEGAS